MKIKTSKAKKSIASLLVALIAIGCLSTGFTAFGADKIAINSTNFPDATFRSIVSERYNDGSGYLSDSAQSLTFMSVTGMVSEDDEITTLQGIEYFTSLTTLRCASVGLEELDVSALENLTSLTCDGNNLTSLDVSANTSLVTLTCEMNELTSLTLSPSIEKLHCSVNELESIGVSALTALEDFYCDQNKLTSIDVSNNVNLSDFNCSYNCLTEIDLSANTALEDITEYMIGNQSLTIEAVVELYTIVIDCPVSNSTYLTDINVSYDGERFVAYDVSEIADGIDYTYYPNVEGSEDMSVHIDVTRNFYQVDYYMDDSLSDLIGSVFVNAGEAAKTVKISNTPDCKTFSSWSEDLTSVQSDMSVYAVWDDSHTYELTAFSDGVATISCTVCGDSYTVNFVDCVNSQTSDSNYNEYLDVVPDGTINAKDYAELIKMF